MKLLYRTLAEVILLIHFLLFLFVLLGPMFPDWWYLYMGALFATLLSDIALGYCIFSKWEFDLRRKVNPELYYDFAWATYYTYKLTNQRLSNKFYNNAIIVFFVFAISINLYFKFWY